MILSKEELVLAACLLETTDASLSAEDAVGDVMQITMGLSESLDPVYRSLLAKAACILLSSNRLSPGAAIAEARKVMTLAGLYCSPFHTFRIRGRGGIALEPLSACMLSDCKKADTIVKRLLGVRIG